MVDFCFIVDVVEFVFFKVGGVVEGVLEFCLDMNFEVVFFYVGEEVFLGDLEKVGVENVDGDVEFFCYFFVYLVDVFVDYLEFEVVLVNKFW